MSEQKYLDFLISIAHPFFKQIHVKKTLVAIRDDCITGWEKWLQIEFATFLRNRSEVKDWNREISHALGKRMAKNKSSFAINLVIHQRRKRSNLPLEIKHGKRMVGCIQGMIRDLKKVNQTKNSEFESRSIWYLGNHPAANRNDVLAEVSYYTKKQGLKLREDFIASERIGNPGFSFSTI